VGRRLDLVPARANGQPAFGAYLRVPAGTRHATGLYVLTLAGDRICALTRFEASTGHGQRPHAPNELLRVRTGRIGVANPDDVTGKLVYRGRPDCGEGNVVRSNDFSCASSSLGGIYRRVWPVDFGGGGSGDAGSRRTMRRRRPQPGEVLQIALLDGTFAYGRVLRGGIAFYRTRTTVPGEPPIGSRDYEFVVSVFDDAARGWPVVGQDPPEGGDEWAPPTYIEDVLFGRFRIYEYGEMRPATRDEIRGLDPQAIYDEPSVVSRLMTGERPRTVAEHVRAQRRKKAAEQAGRSEATDG
jgi:hypothetical protein